MTIHPATSRPNSLAAKVILRVQASELVSVRLRRWLLNSVGARLHPTSEIRAHCRFGTANIQMGAGAFLSWGAMVDNTAWLVIEDGARIGPGLRVITRDHEITTSFERRSSGTQHIVGAVTIGRGAKLGAECCITPGVRIAPGTVYGIRSLIIRSSEPNGLYHNAVSQSGAVYALRDRNLATEVRA